MYVNRELNNFGNIKETYYMQKAVQDTTEYVSDEFLENIMETIAKEHGYDKEFNIANHIHIIFDRIIKTEKFKKYLKEAFSKFHHLIIILLIKQLINYIKLNLENISKQL